MNNYLRMTPVYLSQMREVKEKDKTTWIFSLKVYFQSANQTFHLQQSDQTMVLKKTELESFGRH